MANVKGGDKLDRVLADIARQLGNGKASVQVGFMGNATEPDGTPVALVAALNEYGTGKIPPRPFFRTMIDEHADEWPVNLATALKSTKFNTVTSLGLVGLRIRDQLRRSIRDFSSPPNAPSTIARKGFNNPLIDTSTMLKSATFKVNPGDL